MLFPVSIPDRYAKNTRGDCNVFCCRRFQFLIGTLKTNATRLNKLRNQQFQFLIGTLKTVPCFFFRGNIKNVSIPDRYAKNLENRIYSPRSEVLFQFLIGTLKTQRADGSGDTRIAVSIPDRYAKNELGRVAGVTALAGFQFLIGTLKTGNGIAQCTARLVFQFLIGTLKTPQSPILRAFCVCFNS